MEILKTYVVLGSKTSEFEIQMFQKLHFTKGGFYFLDSGEQLLRIEIEEALALIHAKF